tara:strand:- start:5729 stop:5965 length:237 start_codon:yes stop_codon:yes gene_type:complete
MRDIQLIFENWRKYVGDTDDVESFILSVVKKRFTVDEAVGLVRAIERKIELDHPIGDLLDFNIGVFESTPDRFIFFDV